MKTLATLVLLAALAGTAQAQTAAPSGLQVPGSPCYRQVLVPDGTSVRVTVVQVRCDSLSQVAASIREDHSQGPVRGFGGGGDGGSN